MSTIDPSLKQKLESHSQQHVLEFWDQLDAKQQASLSESLSQIDFDQLNGPVSYTHLTLPTKA